MTERTVSAEDLRRLKREREEAERLFREALASLDRARQALPAIPHPPPEIDTSALDRLSTLIETPIAPPAHSGRWLRRVRELVWSVIKPVVDRQTHTNNAIAAQLTQAAHMHRQTVESVTSVLTLVRQELEALCIFEHWVAAWSQRMAAFVDTKDREETALLRRANEDLFERQDSSVAVMQRRQLSLKRQLEALLDAPPEQTTPLSPVPNAHTAPPSTSSFRAQNAYQYVAFEETFRGSQAEIGERLSHYGDHFRDAPSTVLDVGCGRGEFLALLNARGITARGLDSNPEMVALCRERNLDVVDGDALEYLSSIPEESLGGLIATQVVEHFRPNYLIRFLDLAYEKLQPGSTIILETLNVNSWSTFFGPYLRDITHERPVPPETLRFLVEASGFQRTTLEFSSPAEEEAKLQRVDPPIELPDEHIERWRTFNGNVDKINALLFTHVDYAAIAQKL